MAEKTMSDQEIVCTYRQAPQKAKQIQALSELNLTTPEEIIRVLEENGETVPARTVKALRRQRATEERPVEEPGKETKTELQSTGVFITGQEVDWMLSRLRQRDNGLAMLEALAAMEMILSTR